MDEVGCIRLSAEVSRLGWVGCLFFGKRALETSRLLDGNLGA